MPFRRLLFLLTLIVIITCSKAQLSGTYSVPGSFSSLASAINSLNVAGVNGPVIINIAAGHTETVPTGGFSLTATGTSTSPIIFQKSGTGVNPLITAYMGGTATPASALQDGMWRLIGSDYVTIDGIDLSDPNTSNPATMEFGYGLFKGSAADGCQNNLIKNCVITLNRVNNAVGAGPAIEGSKGIEMINALSSSHTVAVTVTVSTGSNSNNKFYSNVIQNCNYGISMFGYPASSPLTNADTNNDVGGNSVITGNSVLNYGGGGTTSPAAAIRSLAQYNFNISYNLINSNNGSGFNHQAALRGILLNAATSADVTVTNNTVTVSGGGTTSQLTGIENFSGITSANNSVTISNNLIANCTYTSATSGIFRGILNSGGPEVLSINNNTLLNNSTSASAGNYYGIYSDGNVGSTANFINNVIDMGTFNANSTNLNLAGIYISSAANAASINISGNTFQNVNFTGSTGGSGTSYIIYNSAAVASLNINNNNFNNLSFKHSGTLYLIYTTSNTNSTNVSNNFISGGFTKTTSGGPFYGYYSNFNNGSVSITGNNFSNITLPGATGFNGIHCNGNTSQLLSSIGNTIANVSTGGATAIGLVHGLGAPGSFIASNFVNNISGGATVYGIQAGNVANVLSVYSNTIGALSSSGAVNVFGIFMGTSGGSNLAHIYKNKIYDLSGSHASATVSGIYVAGGSTVNVSNNLVGDLRATNSNSVNNLTGIYFGGGNNMLLSYNTVYLEASSSGVNFGSAALYANTTPTLILRNNIFINNSTANGTGKTIAFQRSSTTLTTYSSSSGNNIFYAGSAPSPGNCIFYDGTNTYSTLSNYINLVSPRDVNSYSENTVFTSTAGANAGFLHINNSFPSLSESNGLAVAGISDDVDGQIRFGNGGYTGSGVGVDIGADEYNGQFIDFLPPAITYTLLGTTCSTGDRTISATVSDFSGVPTTGSLVPAIYYKKNSGAYFSSSGVLASGTSTSGVWNFTISSSALGGVAINDIISYFIIAQDTYSNANVSSNPASGLIASSVVSLSAYPSSPNFYTLTALAGTYSVGSGGTFSTLTEASNAYNLSCLNGPVNFVLTDVLYSGAETFPIVFQNNSFASASNSLNIYPATGVTTAITPTLTSIPAVFKFVNARYITVDGLNTGGSSMNISNSNSTTANAGIWLASSGSGCTDIGIKNLYLTGGSNTVTQSYGIISGSNTAAPNNNPGADNDNITIHGLNISKYYHGIYATGTASTVSGGINNWIISNNQIGPAISNPLNNLTFYGMFLRNAQNMSVTGNTISNITSTVSYLSGVRLDLGVSSTTLNSNKITSVKYTGNSGSGGLGVDISTGNLSSNLLIQNNMISDITGDGNTNFNTGAFAGIRILFTNATGGVKIYNNTIAMTQSNTINGSSAANLSACIFVASPSRSIDIVNNLLYSDIQFTNTASKTYALYSEGTGASYTAMNFNNYFVVGSQGKLVRWSGTDANTLSFVQSLSGDNVNSQNVAVVFNSVTDPHLIPTSNYFFDNLGTPLSGITTDIDGQSRSLTTPDIGADEFTAPSCSTVSAVNVLSPTIASCAGQSVTLTRSAYPYLPGLQQNWQIGNAAGGPYTLISSATGTAFTTPTLSPGTYYYVVANTCSISTLTAVSNEATVNVTANPIVSAATSNSVICYGAATTLTASGALSYTWAPSSGLSNVNSATVNASPSNSITYIVTGANANGCTSNNTVTVNVRPPIGNLATSYTTGGSCSGAAASLQAVATSSVYTVTPIPFSPVPIAPGYTLCKGGTVTTMMNSGDLDNGDWYIVPFNFNFTFFSTTYTGCAVSSNGFVTFQTVSFPATNSGFGNTFPSGLSGRPSAGAVYGDLTFANTGTINAFTTGSSPNRRFVVSWSNGQYRLTSSTATGTITTQLVLYEGSNILEVHTTRATGQTPAVEAIQDFYASVAYAVPGRNNTTFTLTNDAYRWDPSVTYSWQPSTYLNTTTNSAVYASGVVNNIVYTVVASAPNGCSMSNAINLNIGTFPNLSISGPSSVCVGSSVNITVSGASTYSWSTGSSGSLTIVSPTAATVYTVSGTNGSSCTTTSTISVNVFSTPTVIITGNSVFCQGLGTTLTATGANTYTWNTTSNSPSITVSPSGNTAYTVTGTDVNSCTNTAVRALTVYPLPAVSVSGNTAICIGNSATLTAAGTSTGYVWSNSALGNSIVITPTVTSTYSVVGTSSAGCVNSASVIVNAALLPTVSISGNTITCSASGNTLTASGANSYTWSNGFVGSVTVVSPSVSTNYTVTGANNAACSNTATYNVSTYSLPVISISGSTAFCVGGTATLSASGAASFTWNTATASQSIVVSPIVNTNYTVTGTDANLCTNTAVSTITVYALPTITISGSASVCAGNSGTLTASGTSTAYVWSTSATTFSTLVTPLSTSNYTVTGTGNQGCQRTATTGVTVIALPTVVVSGNTLVCSNFANTLSASGADTYSWSTGATGSLVVVTPSSSTVYTVAGLNNGACSNTATFSVNTYSLPLISILGSTAFCVGGSATLSASGATSYTWSTASSSQNIIVSPVMTSNYTVTGTDANLCTNTAVSTVTVYALPTISISGSPSICIGSSGTLIAIGTSTSYVWSNSSIGNSIVISPTTSSTFSVTGTSSASCQNSVSQTIAVNPLPNVSISGNSITCSASNNTLIATGATTYSWNSGATGSANVVSPTTSTVFTVIGTDANGCVNTAISSMSVIVLPVVTASITNASVCSGASVTVNAAGAHTYSWTGAVFNGIPFVPVSSTTYSVTGTDTLTGCTSTNNANVSVTVYSLPTVSAAVSSSQVCMGVPVTISGTGANTYTWTGGITNGLAFTPTANASYSVVGTNTTTGCTSTNTAIFNLTVNTLPVVSASITSGTICAGSSVTATASGADTYNWSGGITNAVAFFPGVSSTYSVTGTNTLTGCTSTNLAVVSVSVNPLPTLSITASNTTVCIGGTVNLQASGATTYSWNNGVINTIAFTPIATNIYSVTGTNTVSGCFATNFISIVVNPLPTVTAISSASAVCLGGSVNLQGSGADVYSWTGGITNGTPFIPSSTSTYSVIGTNTLTGCSSTNNAFLTVIVNGNPSVSISASGTSVCAGSSLTLSGAGANTYQWNGGVSNGIPFAPIATSTYVVVGTNTLTACTGTASQIITVLALPNLTVLATNPTICQGFSTSISATGAHVFQFSGGIQNGVSFSPPITTTFVVVGTNTLSTCTKTATQVITVNALPVLSISASRSSICIGESCVLTASGANSYSFTNGVVNGVPFSPTVTTTYNLTGTNTITGCTGTNNPSQIITVNPLPVIVLTASDTLLCRGETATIVASGASTYLWDNSSMFNQIVITPVSSGNYSVTGTDNNLCKNSAAITLTVTECEGITHILYQPANNISIQPNPNSGRFVIDSPFEINLSVVNEVGQVLKEITVEGIPDNYIDLSELPAGIYILLGSDKGHTIKEKFIIQK